MIDVIVSDLGQVILPFDIERAWQAILPRCTRDEAEVRATLPRAVIESGLGVGRASAAEFHARLSECCGLEMPLDEFCAAWSDMFWVDEAVVGMIAASPVRQRVLLSNTNPIHWDWIARTYPEVLRPFDRLIVSHECRLEKPDPEIYRLVARRTGFPLAAHLFIDDLEENVRAARAAGMDGIVHTDAEALRREFARRGLLAGVARVEK